MMNPIISAENSNIVMRAALNKLNGLNLFHANIRSLFPKRDELMNLFDNVKLDILCFSETWFNNFTSDGQISFPGFYVHRNDRSTNFFERGGGVCIYIRDNIKSRVVYRSTSDSFQILLVEISLTHTKVLVGVCYKRPLGEFLDAFNGILEQYSLHYNHIILCGDFNYDLLTRDSQATKFCRILDGFSLKTLNSEPTHFSPSKNSLLDLIITNTDNMQFINQLTVGFTNHDILFFSYRVDIPTIENIVFRDYKNIDVVSLHGFCASLPWHSIYLMTDIDSQVAYLNNLIITIFDKFIPVRNIKVKQSMKPPWFNSQIEFTINQRDAAYTKWSRRKTHNNRDEFKKFRNKVNNLIKYAKIKYYGKSLNPALPTKIFWKNLQNIGIGKSIPNNNYDFSAAEINKSFCDFGTRNPTCHIPATTNRYDQISGIDGDNSFTFHNVDILELQKAVRSIKSNAIGSDGIPLKFIKLIFPIVGVHILYIINGIITKSTFPSAWKKAKIIPIPKIKTVRLASDLRPISILQAISKVCERLLEIQMKQFINNNDLLSRFQSAYRVHHSTSTAVLHVVDDIRREMDKGNVTILTLLDFTKAFDSVDHALLCNKLKCQYNFSSSACKLISSYLSNRSQAVYFGSDISEFLILKSGVPQGSILGPLLFSLYINDLGQNLRFCKFHMFADDVQIYYSGKKDELNQLVTNINDDISSIFSWATNLHLKLNPKKTQSIIMSRSILDSSNVPKLKIYNDTVNYLPFVKNLGITLDCNLSWDKHVNVIKNRICYILRSLWSISKYTTVTLRKKLFTSLMLPHFIYGDCIFFGLQQQYFALLQSAFNSCIRFVFRKRKFDHISMYANELLGCNLRVYYIFRICIFISNIIDLKDPTYLYEKLEMLRSARSNNLLLPKNRSTIFNNSFFVQGISVWNSLPIFIKNGKNNKLFRKNLFEYLINAVDI